MIDLQWPWVLALLPVLPLALWRKRQRKTLAGNAIVVPFYDTIQALQSAVQGRRRVGTGLVWPTVVWALFVVALSRPTWFGEPVALPISGRDIVMAIDLSGSMERADFVANGEPLTRLEITKQVAAEFILRRRGDRIGLILFGRQAYTQTPLTFDHTMVATMLGESAIGLAGKETAIGDAIGLAVKRFRQATDKQQVLVLMTDGANTAGEMTPAVAADLAASEGLKIYTIGIGADSMRVDSLFGSQVVNPSADLDEASLRNIADTTGGQYFRARTSEDLRDIYARIDTLEPTEKDTRVYRPTKDIFYWPLAIGLLLFLVTALWRFLPSSSIFSTMKPGFRGINP